MCVNKATIVANINGEKGDKCYISAGRSGSETQEERGMLFYKCHIRVATEDELDMSSSLESKEGMVWLARPWRWWGRDRLGIYDLGRGCLEQRRLVIGFSEGQRGIQCG